MGLYFPSDGDDKECFFFLYFFFAVAAVDAVADDVVEVVDGVDSIS